MATTITRSETGSENARDPRVRVRKLLDQDSGEELRPADDSGAYAVRGQITGVPVVVYCSDATTMGGAMGTVGCDHIVTAIDTAVRERCPVIGLWHSGGARLGEGVQALDGVGRVFEAMVRASGKVPQISVVLGPAAGGAAYGPALTDIVVMAPEARVFVTGPDVVRSVTGQAVDMVTLGGPELHSKDSGVVHVTAEDEEDAYLRTRRLTRLLADLGGFELDLLPEHGPDLRALLPDETKRAYDVRPVIHEMLDRTISPDAELCSTFEELQPKWGPSMVVGLGRLAGGTVGVVANNPLRLAGCLDSVSAEKAARFVRMCDSFGIPLVVLVDVPGYLPGLGQERGGVVRRGAKLLHAFAEATVPRVTLVLRKAYGGAYVAMNSRALGATAVFAWPQAEVAVMSAQAAVGILHRRQLAAAAEDERGALHDRLAAEHARAVGGVDRAVEIGVVDEVIDPASTQRRLASALAAAIAAHGGNPKGHHGNIPL
ncbi:acyl-CoA carboxylase subunit beta [Microtetraspora malaysiensis]|uniref:acyl-CoA carboxylase subunit beta n=1 Tax=Microtetraspora malaysiensis TaxID=161358 RepID=UPI003D90BD6C